MPCQQRQNNDNNSHSKSKGKSAGNILCPFNDQITIQLNASTRLIILHIERIMLNTQSQAKLSQAKSSQARPCHGNALKNSRTLLIW